MPFFEKLFLIGDLIGGGDSVRGGPGHLVAFARGAAKRRGQEIERFGDVLGRGAALGKLGPGAGQLRGQFGRLRAGRIAFGHGAAQRRLDHADAGLKFLPALFRGQQPRLHVRNLFQRQRETFLRGGRLLGPLVAFARKGIETVFIHRLFAPRLFARAARADRIHQKNGGGDDGPGQHDRGPRQRHGLRRRFQANEPGFGVRAQEQTLFRQAALQCRVQTAQKTFRQAHPRSQKNHQAEERLPQASSGFGLSNRVRVGQALWPDTPSGWRNPAHIGGIPPIFPGLGRDFEPWPFSETRPFRRRLRPHRRAASRSRAAGPPRRAFPR